MSPTDTSDCESAGYGYVMIRPDAIELSLDQVIIARLHSAGFAVIKQAMCIVSDRQVDELYPNLHDRPYYAAMKAGMVGRRVMSLIVAGEGDVSQRLLVIKGSALSSSGSIRADLSGGHLLSGDLGERFVTGGLTPEDLASVPIAEVMREDRVHTDETPAEAANSMRVMFTASELKSLAATHVSFATFLEEHSSALTR